MAEKQSYPQIPATLWWGVRNVLKRTPGITFNERTLGVEFQVQETAARQYLIELKRVGLLNEDNKATPLALKWRQDDTYGEAADELLRNAYPEDLVQIALRGAVDRQKIISWFTREGLGAGTAVNKAATYVLIGSDVPSEYPTRGNPPSQKGSESEEPQTRRVLSETRRRSKSSAVGPQTALVSPMPLNVNVQVHIRADATGEQIESIFSAMRRYLYDNPSN